MPPLRCPSGMSSGESSVYLTDCGDEAGARLAVVVAIIIAVSLVVFCLYCVWDWVLFQKYYPDDVECERRRRPSCVPVYRAESGGFYRAPPARYQTYPAPSAPPYPSPSAPPYPDPSAPPGFEGSIRIVHIHGPPSRC
jgi:hypothetical protein